MSERVKSELGCTVSIGYSWNIIFAKFASDFRKPDAITEIEKLFISTCKISRSTAASPLSGFQH